MKNVSKRILILALVLATLMSSLMIPAGVFAAESPVRKKINRATITFTKTSSVYSGNKKAVPFVVTLDGETLTRNVDYVVSGHKTSDSVPGTYKLVVTITGIGAYKGSKTKSVKFTIEKAKQTISLGQTTFRVKKSALRTSGTYLPLRATGYKSDKVVAVESKGKAFKASRTGYALYVPKGLSKGIYYVSVYAKGNKCYKDSPAVTVKVIVY